MAKYHLQKLIFLIRTGRRVKDGGVPQCSRTGMSMKSERGAKWWAEEGASEAGKSGPESANGYLEKLDGNDGGDSDEAKVGEEETEFMNKVMPLNGDSVLDDLISSPNAWGSCKVSICNNTYNDDYKQSYGCDSRNENAVPSFSDSVNVICNAFMPHLVDAPSILGAGFYDI
ncbi:hypothetical protein EGR_09807 [Echinococcus granulosus]|uniref:Uncharacterized protein n=1 Tax=Echinococcus granulosus TaxID=6210 RepID=W6UPK0_ECHGR|nr:hypothetical protein EGR_09807 [Echinococcus granulosus]EUB55339.1 hypothetical protein EGR_09807 [Echinococcus granulosus]